MALFRVRLSQWTTLWIEFNCLWAAESHSEDLLLPPSPQESLTLIRLTFEGLKVEAVFQPPYGGFEPGIFGLVDLHPNH